MVWLLSNYIYDPYKKFQNFSLSTTFAKLKLQTILIKDYIIWTAPKSYLYNLITLDLGGCLNQNVKGLIYRPNLLRDFYSHLMWDFGLNLNKSSLRP